MIVSITTVFADNLLLIVLLLIISVNLLDAHYYLRDLRGCEGGPVSSAAAAKLTVNLPTLATYWHIAYRLSPVHVSVSFVHTARYIAARLFRDRSCRKPHFGLLFVVCMSVCLSHARF